VQDLEGGAVVIAGAGQGLGRSCALRAAQHRASVVRNDINRTNADEVAYAISSAGGKEICVVGSVADRCLAEELIHSCVRSLGSNGRPCSCKRD
jgi:3-oxoacyl-[acyl-carrier protein] reductase